jgi:hypothetical protein
MMVTSSKRRREIVKKVFLLFFIILLSIFSYHHVYHSTDVFKVKIVQEYGDSSTETSVFSAGGSADKSFLIFDLAIPFLVILILAAASLLYTLIRLFRKGALLTPVFYQSNYVIVPSLD